MREYQSKKTLDRHKRRRHSSSYKPPEPKECKHCGKLISNMHQHFKRKHSDDPIHLAEIKRNKKKAKIYYQNNREIIIKRTLEWYHNVNKCDNQTPIEITYGDIVLNF